MGIQNLLFFLVLSIVHADNNCPISYCEESSQIIRFPFWLEGTQPQSCAPPGFNLSCNGQKYPILHIPGSGDFYVRSIYYSIRSITLQDVESCLPRRLLSLNLSSTPFMGVQYWSYTFFSCPKGQVISSSALECASNTTSDIFATKDQADSLRFSKCKKIATVPVPVPSYYDLGYYFGLPINLDLTWDVLDCQDCGSATGGNKQSESSNTALIVAIPILFLLFVIVCCVCMTKRGNNQTSSSIQITEIGGLTGRGLDKSTIENYKQITIGESHVEGPNEETCAICLADYVMKDTIRFMPECDHCFHIECIDKWLSMSRKCPICRITLSLNVVQNCKISSLILQAPFCNQTKALGMPYL